MKYLDFTLLQLEAGKIHSENTTGDEVAIVSISSDAQIQSEDFSADLIRKDVFSEAATVVYLPKARNFKVFAKKDSTLAICRAHSLTNTIFKPFVVRSEDAVTRTVGKGTYERKVITLLGPEAKCERLILGETFNPPGHWSSFPPHKHDRDLPDEEAELEEIYFFRIKPNTGFGFQRIYTDDRSLDKTITITDQLVVEIPRGYHPVCAMPGHEIYYLWFLAGKGKKLIPYTDPCFKWLEGN